MRRLRILHVVTHSQRRGAEMAALDLAAELDAMGHQNFIVALNPAFDGSCEPGMPTLSTGAGRGIGGLLASVWRLRRRLRSQPVDVVLAHGGGPAQVAALARRGRRPVLAWQRILDFPEDFWSSYHRFWWRLLLRRIDAAFALTPELAGELERLGFRGRVWLAPNSRRPGPFAAVDRDEAANRLRGDLALTPEVALMGFVGALVEQKRPERALDVLERVRAAGERVHLVVAGDGPRRGDLEARAEALGLGRDVTFLGHRRDIERVLGGIDVLLLTSAVEGIPGIAIEAHMTGCPVVTFALGRVDDVVVDGETGIVLAQQDVDAMAAAVTTLLDDPATRERFGRAARKHALNFATDRVAREYAAHFAELLDIAAGDVTTEGRAS